MRFYEFARPLLEDTDESSIDSLVGVLSLIKYRMEKEDIPNRPVTIGTIVNLVRNSGVKTFDAADLIKAWDTNLAVQNLIARPTDRSSPVQFVDKIEEPEEEAPLEPGLGMSPEIPGAPLTPEQPMEPGLEPDMGSAELGQEPTLPTSTSAPEGPTGTRQTVSKMADRALKRRQS